MLGSLEATVGSASCCDAGSAMARSAVNKDSSVDMQRRMFATIYFGYELAQNFHRQDVHSLISLGPIFEYEQG